VHLLTIHDHPCFLDKTVDDLKSLPCGYLSLILSELVQPLEHCFDVILSQKFELLGKWMFTSHACLLFIVLQGSLKEHLKARRLGLVTHITNED
jgi:hypothetical protein